MNVRSTRLVLVTSGCLAIATLLLGGCQSSGSKGGGGAGGGGSAGANCPDNCDPTGMQPGKATYRAQQVPGAVIIHASGDNPTPNWKNCLSRSPIGTFPPEFAFHQQRPSGDQIQRITSFEVCIKFPASERVEQVTVRDANGPQTVKVDPAFD